MSSFALEVAPIARVHAADQRERYREGKAKIEDHTRR
jgi:hypothetical protein